VVSRDIKGSTMIIAMIIKMIRIAAIAATTTKKTRIP
jgi:hypothetical protein